jgi:integrase
MARGRKPKVTYWASKGGYGFNYHGKPYLYPGPDDYPDGPNYRRAVLAFTKLICQDTNKGSDDYLVSAALNAYRQHLKDGKKKNAPRFEWIGASFAEKYGTLRVAELKPYHLTDWLRENSDRWGDTTRYHAGRMILGALAFAQRRGIISTNPLAGRMEPDDWPAVNVRGEEARMSAELCELLISEAERHSRMFADYLRILRDTGARPGEIRKAHARHVQGGRIVYRWNAADGITHKTAKKTKRDRLVYLTPQATAILAKLADKNPAGPLFASGRSKGGWTEKAVSHRFARLVRRPAVLAYCKAHGINAADVRCYNFRHTWISNYLDSTGDYYGCAQMCGTSVTMLEKRYGHPDANAMHTRYLAYMGRESRQDASGRPIVS